MKLLRINDIDTAIPKSINFLSNASSAQLEILSYDTAFILIRNELILVSNEPEPERTTKFYRLLNFRQEVHPESGSSKEAASKIIGARLEKIINISNLRKKASKPAYILLSKSIDFLQHYLIHEGAITPRGNYLPHTNFLERDLVETNVWKVFPEFQKFWLFLRSLKTVEDYRSIMPPHWAALYDEYLGGYGYSNAGNAVNCWRKMALKTNASSFAEINDSALIKYRNLAPSDAVLPWSTLLPLLNRIGANVNPSMISYVMDHNTHDLKGLKVQANDSLAYRLDSPEFITVRYPQLFVDTAGFKNVSCVVTRKAPIQAVIDIDDWYIESKDLSNFTPTALLEIHPDSPWIKSQIEYINSLQESSTKQIARTSLRDLNIYLFSYLRNFFDKNIGLPYQYPHGPSDFKAAIYIHTSEIVNQSLYGENDIYPESFVSFFKEINSHLQPEPLQGKFIRIRRFFEYCSAHYIGIEGYEIAANPISSITSYKFRSRSYRNRSVKQLLEIEYWLLFSEFLIKIADTLIDMLERDISVPYRGVSSIPLTGTIKALDYEMKLSTSLPMAIRRLKKIEEKKPRRSKSKSKYFFEVQSALALCVMASSGLRAANVMWLDCQDWDNQNGRFHEYESIWVATDKAKKNGFESLVRTETYEILKRFELVRDTLSNSTKLPIPYKNDGSSKWGMIKPLLGTGETNASYEMQLTDTLTQFLVDFEHQLFRNGLQLGTYTFYAPAHRKTESKSSLTKISKKEMFNTDQEMTALHIKGEPAVLFTAVKLTTLVTPHSLRKTLDTHLSLILGAKFVGGLMTGQTEATVNYYAEITPHRFEKIIALKDRISASLPHTVTVSGLTKDEAEIRKNFSEHGFSGLGGFRLATKGIDENRIPVVNINNISVNATHICIYGNVCPKEILEAIGDKKNCGICPVAVSTPSDLIAITAQIRVHADNISDYTEQLSTPSITYSERQSLLRKRIEECEQAASWYARYEFIRSAATDSNGFVILEDGTDKVKRTIQAISDISKGSALFSRLKQVESYPTLQSERLKRTASRLSRKILKKIETDEFELPDSNPVEIAMALIAKVVNMHNLTIEDVSILLEDSASSARIGAESVFKSWLLEESNDLKSK